jgi:transcriptional regulator with XRE-family HTH domain
MTNAESIDEATGVLDPGVARAGAAAAARRRELDISQRSLAADGIINAGALIAFEKGRSWPRERTRAKLEEVLRWPRGTIAKLRRGEPIALHGAVTTTTAVPVAAPATATAAATAAEAPLIAQAVEAAVHTLGATADVLPPVRDPDFTPRVTTILSDLRQLEAVATRAARIGKVTPALIKALSAVRRRIDDLTELAATAPNATLGQRLYAVRRRANLTISETAQAAGVSDDDIADAEAELPISAETAAAVETLIGALE